MKEVNIRGVILGTGIGGVWMVVAAAAVAGGMSRGLLGLDGINYWAAVILVTTGAAAALGAMIGGGSRMDGVLAGAGEAVVLLGLNFVLNGGQMEGLPLSLLAIAGGCGGALLLSAGRRRGRGRRKIGKMHKRPPRRR